MQNGELKPTNQNLIRINVKSWMWVINSTMLAQKWIGLIPVLVKNKKQNKTKVPYLPTKNGLTTLWSCPKAHAIVDCIDMLLKARKKIVSLFSLLARQHVAYSTEQMLGSCAGFWAILKLLGENNWMGYYTNLENTFQKSNQNDLYFFPTRNHIDLWSNQSRQPIGSLGH